MSTADQLNEASTDTLELVEQEIKAARKEARPTSRQALTQIVHRRTGMPLKDAADLVDAFCNEREPGVPAYLASEFVIGWLKVVAIGNVVIGAVFFFYAARAFEKGQPIWPLLVAGVIFSGLALFSWVKSLEQEVEENKK